jgi:transposase
VDAFGMPVRAVVTEGTRADCTVAETRIDGVDVDYILADRGDDSDAIRSKIYSLGAEAVIPSKRNRKVQLPCDFEIYKLRHLVENAFLKLKKWRRIATRYAKNRAHSLPPCISAAWPSGWDSRDDSA